jgi:hypothetical protein
VSHGYSVAYCDGIEFEGGAACGEDACFYGFAESLQVDMSGHYGRVAVCYADEGFREIVGC